MSLEELGRTILSESSLPKYFWANDVSTTCYVMKRVLIRPILKKTPYELFNGRKPNFGNLKVFGCKCYIFNNGKENIGKFDEKVDSDIFLCYSLSSHAYRVYNKRLLIVEKSIHVVFDEANHTKQASMKKYAEEDDQNKILQKMHLCPEKQLIETAKQSTKILHQTYLPKERRIPRDLSLDNIIGQIDKRVST